MGVRIDEGLTANPKATRLPSGEVQLSQTVHSDFATGEVATIVYSLDGRTNVMFATPAGPAKTFEVPDVRVPPDPTPRTDTVELLEVRGGTGIDTLDIDQEIRGADRITHDSVTLIILDDP